MTSMVAEGHTELAPLLAFRNWLSIIRDAPTFRCTLRRNGNRGPGPFTLRARQLILERLLETERLVPWRLIENEELTEIEQLWQLDRESTSYAKLELGGAPVDT